MRHQRPDTTEWTRNDFIRYIKENADLFTPTEEMFQGREALFVLYSGPGNADRALIYAERMGGIRIDDTPGGQWLTGENVWNPERFSPTEARSIWAAASHEFAQELWGEVAVFCKDAKEYAIYGKVELRHLLRSDDITSINKIEITELQEAVNDISGRVERRLAAFGIIIEGIDDRGGVKELVIESRDDIFVKQHIEEEVGPEISLESLTDREIGFYKVLEATYEYKDEQTGTIYGCPVMLYEAEEKPAVVVVTGLPERADSVKIQDELVPAIYEELATPGQGLTLIEHRPVHDVCRVTEFHNSHSNPNALIASPSQEMASRELEALFPSLQLELLEPELGLEFSR